MAINWTFDTSGTDTFINQNLYSGFGQNEGIDLRIEMNRLLYGTVGKLPKGHWVVLRKFDTSSVSSTYNKYTHEGVNGPAYNYTDVIIRTRRVPVSKRSDELNANKAGVAITDAFTYYFEYTVNPKIGYEIFELDPTFNHSVTVPTISTSTLCDKLTIKRVHPYRLENGNIQYWAVIAEVDQVRF
jgi:hypothetical protein